jgi:hypothetical protein
MVCLAQFSDLISPDSLTMLICFLLPKAQILTDLRAIAQLFALPRTLFLLIFPVLAIYHTDFNLNAFLDYIT